ncbi:MAG: CHASE2 domain-containing protein [Myxococcota bacterium]
MTFLSRRRYELLALAIALVLGVLHVWSDAQPAIGLLREERSMVSGVLLRAIQSLEGKATDFKFKLRGPRAPHPDVVVVAIDEKSVQRLGLWPWSRATMAELVEKLNAAGAKAIGLDMIFTDESVDSAGAAYREVLERFDQAAKDKPGLDVQLADFRQALAERSSTAPDLFLARALSQAPQVVQGVIAYPPSDVDDFSSAKVREQAELLEPHLLRQVPGAVPGSFFEIPIESLKGWTMHSAQTPLPLFAKAGTRLGHFNFIPDVDGTLRRMPLFAKLEANKGLLPALSLQTAATALGAQVEPVFEGDRLTGARLRPRERKPILVPSQFKEPFSLINHPGPGTQLTTLSAIDVLEGTLTPGALAGKVVLVGVTLAGSFGDQRVTPFKELEPGVYSHAAMVSNILSEDFLTRPAGLSLVEALVMLLAALLVGALIPRLRSFKLKAGLIVAAVALGGAVDLALFASGVQLSTVLPALNLLVVSFGVIFLGYLSVDREKLQLRKTFSRYLGEEVMEEALQNPEKLNRGEKREMTVLFSDIRGFTTLSERMLPEKLAAFIKEYLTPMTQTVFDERGTLDKYIGDAVMAFWNAPLDQPDHALRACRASLRFLTQLETLKKKWREENLPEFDIGVGINSGPMIVGNMGSDVRVDYTVMGDAVNLASRLEGTNKEYETRIIFSEGTHALVKDQVVCRRLGAVRVKGKRKPVRIYELRGLGLAQGNDGEAIARFEAGLNAYTEQKWDEAQAHFQAVLGLWPEDAPSRRYLNEIAHLRAHPPGPGWDGVYTATTK